MMWLAAGNVVTTFVDMNGQLLAIYGNVFNKCHNRFCIVSQLNREDDYAASKSTMPNYCELRMSSFIR